MKTSLQHNRVTASKIMEHNISLSKNFYIESLYNFQEVNGEPALSCLNMSKLQTTNIEHHIKAEKRLRDIRIVRTISTQESTRKYLVLYVENIETDTISSNKMRTVRTK